MSILHRPGPAAGLVHFPQRRARRQECAIQMDGEELCSRTA
jgi:hypothetical protein